MRRSQVVDQPHGYALHDHVIWAHEGQAEWREALQCFLQEGVTQHQRLLYVAPQPAAELLDDISGLSEADDLLASGQLEVRSVPAHQAELTEDEVAEVLTELRGRVVAAVADGYTGLRLASAITRTIATPEDAAAHLRFECCVERAAATGELVVLCGLDRLETDLETIQSEFAVHPMRGPGPEAPWLHAIGADTWLLRGQVDMVSKVGFEHALAALAETMEGPELHLLVDQVEFVDVAGLRALVRLADRVATRGCLVLHDPPAWLTRTLTLAYGRVPGLEIRHGDEHHGRLR
ncbi:MAG TPA: MEDS domain-containing protein [Marmoricola sp.]